MIADLKQAFRSLVSAKGFSAIVIVVLAIGIGANTAIFSIVNGVLFRPLPFANADRLVSITSKVRDQVDSGSVPDYRDWKAQSKTIDRMAAFAGNGATLTGRGEAVVLQVALTTSDLFRVLDVPPLLGRALSAADDEKGAELAAVISESLWAQRFGRSPSIVGEGAMLDGRRFTIVGVMPSTFQFPIQIEPVDAWLPIASAPLMSQFIEQRGAHFVEVIGRLADGASVDQANAEIATIARQLAKSYPASNTDRTAVIQPLRDTLVHEYRIGLIVLLCAVASVLLIACANVANLLLARGTARHKEMAVRAAMGASRRQLVRQLLVESLLLALAGGALGGVLALWGVDVLRSASPLDIPRLREVTVDRGVLLFATLVSVASGILFGVVPALLLSRTDASEALKETGRGSSSGRSARMRQTLVVVEVALSLVLLASAGLLVRSLVALQRVNPGFVAEHAIGASLSLPKSRYPDPAAQIAFYRRLLEEMPTLPGAVSSGVSTTLPLTGNNLGLGFTIDGRPAEVGHKLSSQYFAISPDYFRTMGIPLVKGRIFTERDNQDAPFVVVISETLAKKYWPGQDPIGQRISIGYNHMNGLEVVGIVGDVKQLELTEAAQAEMYTPFPQTPWPFLSIVVRAVGDPAAMGGSVRAMVSKLDPDQAVGELKPIAEYLDRSVATPRFTAALVGGFATLALLLAGFGLFSVMAYSVAQRSREIGIRMALGAQASDVRTLVVSQAVRLGAIGLAVGLAGAFAATRVIDSLLFGVTATDPVTFAGVCATLLTVLLLAAYLPARRATRVDPMIALRTE